jgi:hypothetical protein
MFAPEKDVILRVGAEQTMVGQFQPIDQADDTLLA